MLFYKATLLFRARYESRLQNLTNGSLKSVVNTDYFSNKPREVLIIEFLCNTFCLFYYRYAIFLPLHQLWKQYIRDLCHGLRPES